MGQKSDIKNKSARMLNKNQNMKLSNEHSYDFISMSQGQTPMDCVLSENKEHDPAEKMSVESKKVAKNESSNEVSKNKEEEVAKPNR